MFVKPLIIAALILGPTSAIAASPFMITQVGKKFSERKLSIETGQSLVFLNDDEITHNVYSRSKGFEFDLGAQAPGSEQTISFDQPGKIKIRCAIHPRMKLDVKVQ